jgi:hypothetical protein
MHYVITYTHKSATDCLRFHCLKVLNYYYGWQTINICSPCKACFTVVVLGFLEDDDTFADVPLSKGVSVAC